MSDDGEARRWVLACGARYWSATAVPIEALPLAIASSGTRNRRWTSVALPPWAADLAPDGGLLVDAAAVVPGEGEEWTRTDWALSAFLHLTGGPEREHEATHGPILSYAARLRVEPALFDRAWVNRIFLFLRRWAAQVADADEAALFGPLPPAQILLTHDVDALWKTIEIRMKQSAFHAFNAARALRGGAFGRMGSAIVASARFAALPARFETLEVVRRLESERGLRSLLHFYAGPPGWHRRTATRLLIDPAYDVQTDYPATQIRAFLDGGWTIGLHQSSAAWATPEPMREERTRLEAAAGAPIVHCRQHWLRFSWSRTWRAQEAAGLLVDSTLGFNDRPGFRNGSALRVRPWDSDRSQAMRIEAVPMIFMDSQFYDYVPMVPEQRRAEIRRWLDEVRAVGGEASVNWHTHTITDAYGWGDGYVELLDMLAA